MRLVKYSGKLTLVKLLWKVFILWSFITCRQKIGNEYFDVINL